MRDLSQSARHDAEHAGAVTREVFQPAAPDLIQVGSRRWFLRAGLAGIAGLSLPGLLRNQAHAARRSSDRKAVIIIWLSGGPSHIDTWDPKPDAPSEIRGPFAAIPTNVSGIHISEHLPLQAKIMNRLAVIRSVDCKSSTDHFPAPMQAGNPSSQRSPNDAFRPTHPSMGSIAAKFRGPNDPALPAYAGMADQGLMFTEVLGPGPLGGSYEAVDATSLAGRLTLPRGVSTARAEDRATLSRQFDRMRRDLDTSGALAQMDQYGRQALEIVLSGKAERAFRVDLEPPSLRDVYGRHSLGERTLLARRLIEAGVTFVTVSGTFGMFDNHGDDHFAGGLVNGLKPLLGRLDQALYALITDLQARSLLDTTLVLVMGEMGRGPIVNKNGGRDHWPACMSMLMAGGGLTQGQLIGSTDAKGYDVKDGRVTPSDLAATVYRHLGIDLNTQWIDLQGRPQSIVAEGGRPIPELS